MLIKGTLERPRFTKGIHFTPNKAECTNQTSNKHPLWALNPIEASSLLSWTLSTSNYTGSKLVNIKMVETVTKLDLIMEQATPSTTFRRSFNLFSTSLVCPV